MLVRATVQRSLSTWRLGIFALARLLTSHTGTQPGEGQGLLAEGQSSRPLAEGTQHTWHFKSTPALSSSHAGPPRAESCPATDLTGVEATAHGVSGRERWKGEAAGRKYSRHGLWRGRTTEIQRRLLQVCGALPISVQF